MTAALAQPKPCPQPVTDPIVEKFEEYIVARPGDEKFHAELAEAMKEAQSFYPFFKKNIYLSPVGGQCGAVSCESNYLITIEYDSYNGQANPGFKTVHAIIHISNGSIKTIKRIFRTGELLKTK